VQPALANAGDIAVTATELRVAVRAAALAVAVAAQAWMTWSAAWL
jgi:hypothetical protein